MAGTGTFTVTCKRSLLFVETTPVNPDQPWVSMPTGQRVIVPVSVGPYTVPDWLRENLAYQDCVKFGVITEVIIVDGNVQKAKATPPPKHAAAEHEEHDEAPSKKK